MSSQRRGGGRRGGGLPSTAPPQGPRGGGSGSSLPYLKEEPVPPVASHCPPSAPSSSTSPAVASSTSLREEIERRLTISDSSKDDDAKAVEALAAPPPPSKKGLRHPPRPGFGTVGRRCVVRANHFLIAVADKDLFHYDVSVTPEPKSRATNRKVISELVKLHKNGILGKRLPAFDGRKSLYTAGALPFEVKDFTIKFPETSQRHEKEFKVTIRLAGQPSLDNLREFLAGKQIEMPQDVIQALDVVLRESPSSNVSLEALRMYREDASLTIVITKANQYTSVARSFFSPVFGQPHKIGNGLECWRGYYQSLRPTQMGLSLNMDISATSFYKSVNVVEFVAEYLNLQDVSRPLSVQDRSKIKKVLRGVRVETIHRKDSSACYRINGITPEQMKHLNFSVDGQQNSISVVQYFMGRYKWNLKYVSWPCLQAGSERNPTYLPMEVCRIVEGQRYSKKLNERQVTEILRATCQPPKDREKSIMEMVYQNNYTNDNYSMEFGIRMKYELTSVEARVLSAPTLKYHDSGREKSCQPTVGHWNMINKKMVNGGSIDYWTCLNFASRLRQDEVFHFCDELIRMCNSIGMVINPRPFVDIRSDRPDRVEHALRDVSNRSLEELERRRINGKHIQLLIVILPEISGSYGKIKRICETELAIVSQCCLPKHVPRCNMQYLENVALKINVKAGGRNTVLEDALYRRLSLVSDRPTIIFGADVTHPPPGEDSSSSIAAVVASTDWPEITNYRGLFSAQPHREEIIRDLFTVVENEKKKPVYGGMIRELLITFYRSTKHKPDRIIFYRDGVSEGQFRHVLQFELDAIKKACVSIEDGYLPPVTFVVVQKRHHTRLFPEVHGSRNLTDRSGNILAGTVVDRKICHPTEFDFYLCSHAGIQGTSRPTHYHVLVDENKFTADGLQTLTNSLCYTYARCTRSVSVVPPAYYAHLAAYRARYYMEGEFSEGSGSGRARDMPVDVRQLPQVQEKVKEVMFFC